ncbi:MAG: hypothetical protein L0H96_20185, partial [Humibacillus sp.]|nr:hypothetical protein [Humibacillus sp.]
MADTQPAPTVADSQQRQLAPPPSARPPLSWRNPMLSLDERTDALLAALTVEEKVGQLGSRWLGNDMG